MQKSKSSHQNKLLSRLTNHSNSRISQQIPQIHQNNILQKYQDKNINLNKNNIISLQSHI
jgi:hypothetical protein